MMKMKNKLLKKYFIYLIILLIFIFLGLIFIGKEWALIQKIIYCLLCALCIIYIISSIEINLYLGRSILESFLKIANLDFSFNFLLRDIIRYKDITYKKTGKLSLLYIIWSITFYSSLILFFILMLISILIYIYQ